MYMYVCMQLSRRLLVALPLDSRLAPRNLRVEEEEGWGGACSGYVMFIYASPGWHMLEEMYANYDLLCVQNKFVTMHA